MFLEHQGLKILTHLIVIFFKRATLLGSEGVLTV